MLHVSASSQLRSSCFLFRKNRKFVISTKFKINLIDSLVMIYETDNYHLLRSLHVLYHVRVLCGVLVLVVGYRTILVIMVPYRIERGFNFRF